VFRNSFRSGESAAPSSDFFQGDSDSSDSEYEDEMVSGVEAPLAEPSRMEIKNNHGYLRNSPGVRDLVAVADTEDVDSAFPHDNYQGTLALLHTAMRTR